MQESFQRIVALVILIAVPIFGWMIMSALFEILSQPRWLDVLEKNFPTIVGLPMAAMLSAFIVVGLRQVDGPVEFEGLGFKFVGASGQVVMWIACFMAITSAIHMLWQY